MSEPGDKDLEHAGDHFEDHIQEVQEWLDKNVRLYSNPNKLRLHSFTFDQLNDEGNFCVNFDDEDAETFSFRLGGSDGYTKIYTPAYHYPLGAPASYQAIELTDKTRRLIEEAVRQIFPRIRPFGRNRETGKHTDQQTPVEDRIIDAAKHQKTIAAISEGNIRIEIDMDKSEIRRANSDR